MGMMDRLIGMGGTVTAVGNAASGMAEIFTQNQTRRMELDEEAYARAMAQYGTEFTTPLHTWWDSLVNGLNRLPRPVLTLGTLALFVYAMIDPIGFSKRMEGLGLVPEPLWWLMGAIISFYFGAREAHHFRTRVWPRATVRQTTVTAGGQGAVATVVQGSGPDVLAEALNEAMGQAPAPSADAQFPPRFAAPSVDVTKADSFADNAALADWAMTTQRR